MGHYRRHGPIISVRYEHTHIHDARTLSGQRVLLPGTHDHYNIYIYVLVRYRRRTFIDTYYYIFLYNLCIKATVWSSSSGAIFLSVGRKHVYINYCNIKRTYIYTRIHMYTYMEGVRFLFYFLIHTTAKLAQSVNNTYIIGRVNVFFLTKALLRFFFIRNFIELFQRPRIDIYSAYVTIIIDDVEMSSVIYCMTDNL